MAALRQDGGTAAGADALLEAMSGEVAARLLAAPTEPAENRVRVATDLYCQFVAACPALEISREIVAREALVPAATRVGADAAEARLLARDDPGAPGLEDACDALLSELSDLAAVFAEPMGRRPGEFAPTYRAICTELAALAAATTAARPTWGMIRGFALEPARTPAPPASIRGPAPHAPTAPIRGPAPHAPTAPIRGPTPTAPIRRPAPTAPPAPAAPPRRPARPVPARPALTPTRAPPAAPPAAPPRRPARRAPPVRPAPSAHRGRPPPRRGPRGPPADDAEYYA